MRKILVALAGICLLLPIASFAQQKASQEPEKLTLESVLGPELAPHFVGKIAYEDLAYTRVFPYGLKVKYYEEEINFKSSPHPWLFYINRTYTDTMVVVLNANKWDSDERKFRIFDAQGKSVLNRNRCAYESKLTLSYRKNQDDVEETEETYKMERDDC